MSQRIDDVTTLARLIGIDETGLVTMGERSWSVNHRRVRPTRGTVLLVAGLGMHRIEWSAELIHHLNLAGYDTLTVDNHDAGGSQLRSRDDRYSLRDMALDLVGLLNALRIARVHIVGLSMGGMVAQHFALAAPERAATLTSLASTTGRRGVGRPMQNVKWIFTTPLPKERSEYEEYVQEHHRAIASRSHQDLGRAGWLGEQVWRRGLDADGYARQLAAIGDDGDRSERLAMITVPTLVVHGDEDPMIDISGGRDTAAAIAGSTFITIPEMGHLVTWQNAHLVAAHLVDHFERTPSAR